MFFCEKTQKCYIFLIIIVIISNFETLKISKCPKFSTNGAQKFSCLFWKVSEINLNISEFFSKK